MTVKVRQREYGIRLRDKSSILQTENIWTCTGFVGVNRQGIAFLCHFDTPCSVSALPAIVTDLKRHTEDLTSFEIRIITGKAGWLLGWFTRNALRRKIRKLNVFSSIPKTEFLTRSFLFKCGIHVDAHTGNITTEEYFWRREYKRYAPRKWYKFATTRVDNQENEENGGIG